MAGGQRGVPPPPQKVTAPVESAAAAGAAGGETDQRGPHEGCHARRSRAARPPVRVRTAGFPGLCRRTDWVLQGTLGVL